MIVALLFVASGRRRSCWQARQGSSPTGSTRGRVLLVGSLVQAALALALAFVSGTAAVLVLAALLGSAFALSQPAEFALIPGVAGEARLTVANGRVETAR